MNRLNGFAKLVVGLCLAFATVMFGAASAALADDAVRPDHGLPRLQDGAGLLTNSQAQALEERLDQLSRKYGEDVVIVTVPSINGRSIVTFGDDYFYYGPSAETPLEPASPGNTGYGLGRERSGIMLLVASEDREARVVTHGDSIQSFTDARQERIMSEVRPRMSRGDWNGAFDKFAGGVDEIQASQGRPNWLITGAVAVVAGLLGGFVPVTIWRRQLKSVQMASGAKGYIEAGSAVLATSHDKLIGRNTQVVDLTPPSGSGGGGGSTTHRHSSGSTFGGSSHRF
jgi:uncharacterized protein